MAKLTFTIEQKSSEVVLKAQGDLNVQHARAIKQFYEEILTGLAMDVHLDLQKATAFDVSAAQLSYLLRTEVQRQGFQFKITMPVDAGICDLLDKCGINKIIS